MDAKTLETFFKINAIIPIHWIIGVIIAALIALAKFLFNLWKKQEALKTAVAANSEKDKERHDDINNQLKELKDENSEIKKTMTAQNNLLIEIKTLVNLLVDNRITKPLSRMRTQQ